MNTFFDRRVLDRVRAEYLEMPGMKLRIEQVQRLCGIDETTCKIGPGGTREGEHSVSEVRRNVREAGRVGIAASDRGRLGAGAPHGVYSHIGSCRVLC